MVLFIKCKKKEDISLWIRKHISHHSPIWFITHEIEIVGSETSLRANNVDIQVAYCKLLSTCSIYIVYNGHLHIIKLLYS